MKHFSVHKLEREIAEVLKKGFKRETFDDADCLQAGHDVADYILSNYRIDEHPYINPSAAPGSPLEAVAGGSMTIAEAYEHFGTRLGALKSDLAKWAGMTGSEEQ